MHVPEGWSVTGTPGRRYELTRENEDGALHISVYERTAAPLTTTEAVDLMNRFLGTLAPVDPVEIRVLLEGREQVRTVARCTSLDSETGDRFDWLVLLVLWPRSFLLCSSTSSVGSSLSDEAEMMFAAIAPAVKRPRGMLRRTD